MAIVLTALTIVGIASFEIYLRTGGDSPEPANAVVVLGPGRDGERLERAEALLDEQLADTLVVSMGRGGQRRATDAVCASQPTDFEVICFRADPFTTRGEARAVARLAAARGWTKLLVVTSDLPRQARPAALRPLLRRLARRRRRAKQRRPGRRPHPRT